MYNSYKIDYGHCEHFDDDCVKRYFNIYDPFTADTYNVSVCNQYLALKIKEKNINKKQNSKDSFIDIVCEIVKDSIFFKYQNDFLFRINDDYECRRSFYSTKYLNDLQFNLQICEKPYLTINLNLISFLNHFIDDDNFYYNTKVINRVTETIRSFIDFKCNYKKYKILYKECNIILNKLQKGFLTEEKKLLFNQLFINILKLETHETSKQ